ncbi:MAG: hypothetical protein U0793_23505 [Gemmataceae bacterium]
MRGTWLRSMVALGVSAGLLGFFAQDAAAQRKGDQDAIRAQLEKLKEQVRALEAKLGKGAEPKGKFGKFEGKFDPAKAKEMFKKFEGGKSKIDREELRAALRELFKEKFEGAKGKFDKKDMAKKFGEKGKGGPPWARGGMMGKGGPPWMRGGEKGKGGPDMRGKGKGGPDVARGKGKGGPDMARGKGKGGPMARGGDRGAPPSRDAELRRALDQLDRSVQALRKALEQRGR